MPQSTPANVHPRRELTPDCSPGTIMSIPTTTSPTTTQPFALRTFSVESLLEAFESKEPWTLHVAQRAFEWPHLRLTNLVDSLLRGFPIGTLLLAESSDHHYDLVATQQTR